MTSHSLPMPLLRHPGGMENWGLITYRETALLYNNVTGSLADKRRVGEVVSHELAHQWFGDIVTPQWWNDLWYVGDSFIY